MYSRLPTVFDKSEDFWYKYNKTHAKEHQDMASWISALAKAKNLGIEVTYYSLPPFDPQDEKKRNDFFDVNWKQHQLFYDFINKIGHVLTVPVFTFPKNYPSPMYDLNEESFLSLEKDIHNMLWRAIDVLKSSL